jgi:hypothetical protein
MRSPASSDSESPRSSYAFCSNYQCLDLGFRVSDQIKELGTGQKERQENHFM